MHVRQRCAGPAWTNPTKNPKDIDEVTRQETVGMLPVLQCQEDIVEVRRPADEATEARASHGEANCGRARSTGP